ncbi:DegT/DnrJ/EryC1/StrS family aminotransferase [Methylibium sp.]|uniref:DegT/DnrJ/EryC1/StrS family aminotransferase n=1 Tax=Methylibium sp. TaxID=2067992 RepID=UPI003D1522CD
MPQPTSEPLIELGAPCLGEPEKQALCAVIDDGWLTMGDRVRRFEKVFAEMHGADDAVAVHSATAALQLSLQAFDIGPGDEVLVPSLTFVATTNTILHSGATPIFVDIEGVSCPHLSLEDARRKLSPRTRAVMLMHYGGYLMDAARWREFADQHGLLLFEDAAHAAGMRGTGTLSEAASYSFFTNKNMTTAEGGMMIVRDEKRRQRARVLRAHGMTASTLDRARGRAVGYDVVDCGHNYRMDELRAAMGLVQIERLLGWNDTRRTLTAHYRKIFARTLPSVQVPFKPDHETSAHIMPVLLPEGTNRHQVMERMRAQGVQSSMHYPPIHHFEYYRNRFPGIVLPETERYCERELTIPLHPQLSTGDVERVVASLGKALEA